jgi:GT2 family glycosyltransferase
VQNTDCVSIIIPTFNRAEVLKRTLPSYLAQRHVKEIIVVSDGGTDHTEEVVNAFSTSKLVYVAHDRRLGSPAARNTGISHSSGDYVLFGEDDVEFSPQYTEELLRYSMLHDCPIVSGRVIYMSGSETWSDAEERVKMEKTNPREVDPLSASFKSLGDVEQETFLISALSLIRRDVFDHVQFSSLYKGNAYREETDFYVTANKFGYRTVYVPSAVAYHLPRELAKNGGQQSMSRWAYEYWTIRNHWIFLCRHFKYLQNRLGLKYPKLWYLFTFAIGRLNSIVRAKLRRVFL